MDDLTLEAARRGDRDARDRLLRQSQDRWFRFCLSLLGDQERARDATQETAFRVLRDLHRFAGRSQFETWSMGIALNVVREMRRQKGADAAKMALAMDLPPRQPIQSPADAAQSAETADRLRALLADLPDRQREAVVLRYFEGLSIEETAGVMGCAAGTVKATVHQTLRTLKEKLKQWI